MTRAIRELDAAGPGRSEFKPYVLVVDGEASHPDAAGRKRLIEATVALRTSFIFAFVSTSALARAGAVVMKAMLPSLRRHRVKAFSTVDDAFTWTECEQPGSSSFLRRARHLVDAAEIAEVHRL